MSKAFARRATWGERISVGLRLTTILAAGRILFIWWIKPVGKSKFDQGPHLARGLDFGHACFRLLYCFNSKENILLKHFYYMLVLHSFINRLPHHLHFIHFCKHCQLINVDWLCLNVYVSYHLTNIMKNWEKISDKHKTILRLILVFGLM